MSEQMPQTSNRSASGGMPHVSIVGAGLAGMTAALRLAQRGYQVELFERGAYVGGQFGVLEHKGWLHEHCYHMFCNWYHNFWSLVDELGLRDRFLPRPTVKFLRPGSYPDFKALTNVGAAGYAMQNLCSGLLSMPDMYIYGYSMVDLLSQPLHYWSYLNRYSVNGFLGTRGYATAAAAREYEEVLAKAFAVAPYRTSAISYQKFLAYGFRQPEPMMWVLDGNCHERFLAVLVARLHELGVRIHTRHDVTRLTLDENGRVFAIVYKRVPEDAEYAPHDPDPRGEGHEIERPVDQLILAVPPNGLAALVDDALYAADPQLGAVRNLNSVPVGSIDLYFKRRVPGIPAEHVVMLDSTYGLSFVDQSQTWNDWPNRPNTFLNLVASNFAPLVGLDWHAAMGYILEDLRRYIPHLDADDIDYERSYLRNNAGDPIFVNEVGSWASRPEAGTRIANLFLAGDYCRSVIDVTTIEAATMTGLLAAETLRLRTRPRDTAPISILEPRAWPRELLTALKWMGLPYAWAARWRAGLRELAF
ncbi:MAG: FAD-dependent oxidoreductase [Gammaproteobacteria bacterium]|nr:FAD-dependent oxidoreductase [Gammaproteobacteria bacterium]